jgi:hypothetical protein
MVVCQKPHRDGFACFLVLEFADVLGSCTFIPQMHVSVETKTAEKERHSILGDNRTRIGRSGRASRQKCPLSFVGCVNLVKK